MYTEQEKELMAIQAIRTYLNKDFTDEEIKNKFSLAIKRIIDNINDLLSSNRNGIASVTQGSQSITYDTSKEATQITDEIKMLLPKPYIKLF